MSLSSEQIRMAAKEYAAKIQQTEIYRKYCLERERIKQDPELYAKVNAYRQATFELQNYTDQDQLFDRMDAYEKEYEGFRENPLVESFLQAELAFCRMMQELNILILDHLDFE
ncbi:MAG: YlbF family regulator [Lachnospiraceae bacterium]|nr:YlbF family regulator [Lachnospiraceae bacterium]